MTLSLHIYETSAKFLTKINVNKRRNDSWNARNRLQNWSPEGVSLILKCQYLLCFWYNKHPLER